MHGQTCSRLPEATCARKAAPARLWVALCLAVLAPAPAYAAGGAYVVDDAVIGKPGDCQVETWLALADNHDLQAITQPACVVKLGIPVELTTVMGRTRTDDVWQTQLGAKAKINILPVETGSVGLGLVEQPVWDAASGQYLFNQFYVPLTFQFSDTFRINVNAGWQYDGVTKINYALWGAGFEWIFAEKLTLIGEWFGLAGPATDVNTVSEPRAQLGLRITPVTNLDVDLIYGRNVYGENANWFTLGLNVRF
jgi:hypothetical protein